MSRNYCDEPKLNYLAQLDVTHWLDHSKKKWVLLLYGFKPEVIEFFEGDIRRVGLTWVEFQTRQHHQSDTVIKAMLRVFGYKIVYFALKDLQDCICNAELPNEGNNLMFDAVSENIWDLKSLLGVQHRDTPGVKLIREELDLCEDFDPFVDEEWGDDEAVLSMRPLD